MRIAIIGAGQVGTALARGWMRAGHEIVLGVRDPNQASPVEGATLATNAEEEPQTFILRIRWASTEAHLQGFRKGPHFPPFLAAIKPFIPEITEMRHYAETPLVWTRDG